MTPEPTKEEVGMSKCNHLKENCAAQRANWLCEHEDGPCVACLCKGFNIELARAPLASRAELAAEVGRHEFSISKWMEERKTMVDALTASRAEAQELRGRLSEAVGALDVLYEENADYIRINNLGDVLHNRSMKMAHVIIESERIKDRIALSPAVKEAEHDPDCTFPTAPCQHRNYCPAPAVKEADGAKGDA